MKITKISLYALGLPYVGGAYKWGPGRVITVADTSVVVIDTDVGISGCGECCPCGANYLPAFAQGIAAALPLLATAVLGQDPRQLRSIEQSMDEALKGHGYAKAPIDVACWDVMGKSADLPVHTLLGGKLTDGAPMYRVAPQKPVADMLAEISQHRKNGYRYFQIKVGDDANKDIEVIRQIVPMLEPGEYAFADANTGWRLNDAVRVVNAVADLDIMIEQPCLTYEECLHVRERTQLPMKLDESVSGLDMAERIVHDKAAEVVGIKISNVGGLSKARRVRDYLVEKGIPVVCEDTWGGEITTAALSHLAASTPPRLLFNTTDLYNYNTVSTGTGGAHTAGGLLFAPDEPGLGVEPHYDNLGDPIAVFAL